MMNHVYMSLSITIYRHAAPDCTYWVRVDNGPMARCELSLDEARKLQWELVKAGATRTCIANYFDNAISHVDINYWARR